MSRTTHAELEQLCKIINNALNLTDEPQRRYTLHGANGGHRLERAMESVAVSPRMRSGLLADWMRAFIAGIAAGRQS